MIVGVGASRGRKRKKKKDVKVKKGLFGVHGPHQYGLADQEGQEIRLICGIWNR